LRVPGAKHRGGGRLTARGVQPVHRLRTACRTLEAASHQSTDTTPVDGLCSLTRLDLRRNPLTCPDPVLDDLLACGVGTVLGCP